MTKSEMAEKLAEKINVKKQQAEEIINIFTNSIIDALAHGDKVEIRGFGSFRVRLRAEKNGRNPKTGERVHVPSKKVPFFKTGKDFREAMSNDKDKKEGVESVESVESVEGVEGN